MKKHTQADLGWRSSVWAGIDTSYIGLCPSIGWRNGSFTLGLSVGPCYVGMRIG